MNNIPIVLNQEWSQLKKGITFADHDYHSFVISTIRENRPESRTVILRDIDDKTPSIAFHSDLRSKKIQDINKNNNLSALFYDRSRRIQLRISGSGKVQNNNKTTKKIWKLMRPESKLCYMGPFSPSDALKTFKPNLPKHNAQDITPKNDIMGYNRFCRVLINIKRLDWLYLHHTGHQRLLFNFGEKISFKWIAA